LTTDGRRRELGEIGYAGRRGIRQRPGAVLRTGRAWGRFTGDGAGGPHTSGNLGRTGRPVTAPFQILPNSQWAQVQRGVFRRKSQLNLGAFRGPPTHVTTFRGSAGRGWIRGRGRRPKNEGWRDGADYTTVSVNDLQGFLFHNKTGGKPGNREVPCLPVSGSAPPRGERQRYLYRLQLRKGGPGRPRQRAQGLPRRALRSWLVGGPVGSRADSWRRSPVRKLERGRTCGRGTVREINTSRGGEGAFSQMGLGQGHLDPPPSVAGTRRHGRYSSRRTRNRPHASCDPF